MGTRYEDIFCRDTGELTGAAFEHSQVFLQSDDEVQRHYSYYAVIVCQHNCFRHQFIMDVIGQTIGEVA